MCYTKQIYYMQCNHWTRNIHHCSARIDMKQCAMSIPPNDEDPDNCPRCTDDIATNAITLYPTDHFSTSRIENDYPRFRNVDYYRLSHSSSSSPDTEDENAESIRRGIRKISARLARHGYQGEEMDSPLLEPVGRRWSAPPWASPAVSDESWDSGEARCEDNRGGLKDLDDAHSLSSDESADINNTLRDILQDKRAHMKELGIDIDDAGPLCVMPSRISGGPQYVIQPGGHNGRRTPKPPQKYFCLQGNHRELTILGDLISRELCFGHVDAVTQEEKNIPCPTEYAESSPPWCAVDHEKRRSELLWAERR